MKDNAKCFIKIGKGDYEEITYHELNERTKKLKHYKDKKFIYLSGMLLEVSKKQYIAYHKERERNKYAKKVLTMLNTLSIEAYKEDSDNTEVIGDLTINIEDELRRKYELMKLNEALETLNEDEKYLLDLLYGNEKTLRECSQILHIPKSTLYDKKKNILKKLEKYIKN